jgi:hypothetical protein
MWVNTLDGRVKPAHGDENDRNTSLESRHLRARPDPAPERNRAIAIIKWCSGDDAKIARQ